MQGAKIQDKNKHYQRDDLRVPQGDGRVGNGYLCRRHSRSHVSDLDADILPRDENPAE